MIVTVGERVRADFATAVKPFGLPGHLARTVLLLGEPRSMRGFASELVCDPSHVTGIADQLEERGLVVREPGADRRVKLLRLTDEGAAMRLRIAEATTAENEFANQLDPEQRDALRELLRILLQPRRDITTQGQERTS